MKVNFEVSAKAARLIGRENIADVDGALSELIKNAYDADATCVYVDFQIPFPEVPTQVSLERFAAVLTEDHLKEVLSYYHMAEGRLQRKDELPEGDKAKLQSILFSYNRIVVADNGEGMPIKTVCSSWMQIATSNKETQIESKKGRVKTGAKGIGRFALDKLSTRSVMYTRAQDCKVIRWEVDWDQFTNAQLLRDVQAEIQEQAAPLQEILLDVLDKDALREIAEFSWETGTVFVLSPLREAWNTRLFEKVNTNLKSINPLGSADQFTVIVRNRLLPEYSYRTEPVAIAKEDYDYRLDVSYDGQETLKIKIIRNEFDIRKKNATFSAVGKEEKFPLREFWERAAFAQAPYRKVDWDGGAQELELLVDSFIPAEDKDNIRAVGPFSAELYFVKNGKSDFAFIKDVPTRRRRELLKRFSGVKLYRDNFKVRPYGDVGGMFDWLELDERANRSPAGVSHLTGVWHVRSYQFLGLVKIGREKNPALYDMANREGLTQNESYYYFVRMLQEAIGRFEYDRQYIYREYDRWKTQCVENMATVAEKVAEDVRKHGVNVGNGKAEGLPHGGRKQQEQDGGPDSVDGKQFSERDYREAVEGLLLEKERDLKAKQTLEALSAAGVILNTFFHEFSGVSTELHTRGTQMRARIDYLLNGQPYQGLDFLDPYKKLDEYERIDLMLGAWLKVVMQAIEKNHLVIEDIYLYNEANKIVAIWKQLLLSKRINLRIFPEKRPDSFCMLRMAVVDLYVIINNFVLNSVWFLEREAQNSRDIRIELIENEQVILMRMENNGPQLDEKFRDQPMRIFDIGETAKPGGTGLGLFLMREVVERTDGQIRPIEKTDGFGIEIEWQK